MGKEVIMESLKQSGKPINILLAEDNEDDIEITTMAFQEARIKNNLYIVKNGEQAWDYLTRGEGYEDEEKYPAPQLLLLDINMPRMGGLELLEKVKADDRFKTIPVVMLTSSKNDEDVVKIIRKSYSKKYAAFLLRFRQKNDKQKYKEFAKNIRNDILDLKLFTKLHLALVIKLWK